MNSPYAVEFDSAKKTFTRKEITIPPLEPGYVLIKVICCTICGSDLHTFCGRRNAPAGCVLGHEIIGSIVDWGSDSPPKDFHGDVLTSGQRVTWAMAVGCGECFYCKSNLSQKCESLHKYGHEPGGTGVPTGGLSQYCMLVPGTPIFKIPDSLSDDVACPANCATATVCAAMRLISETHIIDGSTTLVIGAGMLGLTAAAQLSSSGATEVVVGDIHKERLKLANAFGATQCVDMSVSGDLKSVIDAVTNGRGVDIVMDFAGVLPAVETALKAVRIGGCVLLAGSVFQTDSLSVSPEEIVRRMLTIRGLHNYLATDLADGLRFLNSAHQRFPFGDLVSKSFPLNQSRQAFEFANDNRPVRIAIRANAER